MPSATSPRSPDASRVLVSAAALVVIIAGIKLASSLVVPLLLAAFLAMVTSPFVAWLRRHRVPAILAVLAALAVDLVALAGFAVALGQGLAGFERKIPVYVQSLDAMSASVSGWLQSKGLPAEAVGQAVAPDSAFAVVQSVIASFALLLKDIALVLLLLVFMLLEATGIGGKLRHALAPDDFARLEQIAHDVNRYLFVKLCASAATGVLCGAICVVVGVDFPIVWALTAFLLNFVPTVGSFVATVLPTGVALVQLGPGSAALVALGYIAVNSVIGNFVEPRVLGRTLGLSPLVVLLAMVLWGWLLGPAGAVLAVPLTTLVKIVADGVPALHGVAVALGPAAPRSEPRARPPEAARRRLPTEPRIADADA